MLLVICFLITLSINPATALVVDHTAVQQFEDIPDEWLEKARNLTIHYAHTSHGSQINSGVEYIELYINSTKYSFARRTSGSEGLPAEEDPPALRMYDGNPPETYINPNDYWDGTSAMDRTRAVADTGHYNFSMWSWCGQQSGNSEATVNNYLNALNTFESEYPDMRFIYMTGHTDGSDTPDTPGTLKYNNKLVRNYTITHNKVLFDFADIESWDPDGNYYPTTTDACSWCTTWCSNHPEDCLNLPGCAHSHGYNCKMKGKAFWWMMARLAGWGGVDALPNRDNPQPNGILPAGTTQTNISLQTDVQAVCRYSNLSAMNYSDMVNTFTYTNSTTHSTLVTDLQNKKTYIYYVRCNSTDGYVNNDDFNITFSIGGHEVDTNDDGMINMNELIAFIGRWKANDGVSRQEVFDARDIWFTGGVY